MNKPCFRAWPLTKKQFPVLRECGCYGLMDPHVIQEVCSRVSWMDCPCGRSHPAYENWRKWVKKQAANKE